MPVRWIFFDGATLAQISEFESANGIRFPEKFRQWLLFSDGGECFLPAGAQFYGVTRKPFIDVFEDDRPDENYIVIGALVTGDPILFKRDSRSVCIYDHENGVIHDDEIYDCFFTF